MITPYLAPTFLEHGGALLKAASNSTIPVERWLDLSTGINPNGWPVPTVPTHCWQRLPETNDGLEEAAHRYYGADNMLICAGSQSAIQLLPQLFSPGIVWVPEEGYSEHAYWWDFHHHQVFFYQPSDLEQILKQVDTTTQLPFDTLLVINPNNPTTDFYPQSVLKRLLALVERLDKRLVVDEAFLDTQPTESMIPFSDKKSLVVLRSLGKFFGLAGIRCGFLFAHRELIKSARQHLGPWQIATPSRWVATQALLDTPWQQHATQHLQESGLRLKTLLESQLDYSTVLSCEGNDYFGSVVFHSAETMQQRYDQYLSRGILVRKFENYPRLRIGLPGNERQWNRLETTL